jgi:hypothetical protein
VNYAVADYGYYPQTAPKSGRKYAYDLLYAGGLELVRWGDQIEFEHLSGWTSRLFNNLWKYLHLSVIEYQVGPERMENVVAWAQNRDESWVKSNFDGMVTLLREFDVEDAYLPFSPKHPSQRWMLERGSDSDSDGEEGSQGPTYHVAKHDGREDHEDDFYMLTVGENSIDRFSFQITDEAAGKCIAQTELVGDLPPYIVIDSVSEDYEITNIPTFGSDEQTYRESLLAIDSLMRRITALSPPQSEPTKGALDAYLSTLDILLVVMAAYEIAPEEYDNGVRQAFAHIEIDLTAEAVASLPHGAVDQISTAAFQAVRDEEPIYEEARELLEATRVAKRRGTERQNLEDLDESDVSLLVQLADPEYSRFD